MTTTPRPAYIWDANSNDWAPLAGTVDTGQSYNFSAVQNFNGGISSSIINGGSVTGKNYLINGGFDFWQRGTSSSSQMGYYTADRWYTGGTGGTITVAQETTDIPSGVPVQYGIKWTTSASSSYATLYQAIESQVLKTLLGRQVTISGYIKLTGGYTGSMYVALEYNTVNDALLSSNTQAGIAAAGNAVDAATWKRFSATFTVPANAAGLRVGLQPDLAQASGVTVRLAGLKLELGTVATSFSTAGTTLQSELAACQRYYARWDTVNEQVGYYWGNGTTFNRWNWPFPVTMRTIPTISKSASIAAFNPTFTAQAISAIGGNYSSVRSASVDGSLAGSVGTNGQTYLAYILNSSQYVEASAEL